MPRKPVKPKAAIVHHPDAQRHKHHKPYRIRHLGLLIAAIAMLAVSIFYVGSRWLASNMMIDNAVNRNALDSSFTVVKSAYGISFSVDLNDFSVSASEILTNGDARIVDTAGLRENRNLNSVVITPLPGIGQQRYGATRLSLEIASDRARFEAARADPQNSALSDCQIAANLGALSSTTDYEIDLLSQTADMIDGREALRTIYQHTVKSITQLKGVHTFSIQWAGVIQGRPYALTISGLGDGSQIPSQYLPILDSIDLGEAATVAETVIAESEVLGETVLNSEYLADILSPAVVKIHYGICADLMMYGEYLDGYCNGGFGSGFIISSDGYIATNGHVVVHRPVDAFVSMLLADQSMLEQILYALGYDSEDIWSILNTPEFYASLISGIYAMDTEEQPWTFQNSEELILVSIGEDPVDMTTTDDFFNTATGDSIVDAELIDYDYEEADLYDVDDQGFSASDVALLKADLQNAPLIKLAAIPARSNEDVIVLGFPGDAENQIVSDEKLTVSITNGIISSIREARGDDATIYQSDVDASHGSSGGPAINSQGLALGILTYRYQSGALEDASKSYIRDIGDLKDLLDKNDIVLNQFSSTQASWEKGLELYNRHRYSRAVKDFNKVLSDYPAHRLAGFYTVAAQDQIMAGNDIKDLPIAVLIIGAVMGLAGIAVAVFLIRRHAVHHHRYQQTEQLINATTLTDAQLVPRQGMTAAAVGQSTVQAAELDQISLSKPTVHSVGSDTDTSPSRDD